MARSTQARSRSAWALIRAIALACALALPGGYATADELSDLRELVDTVAAYIHAGNYDAVFRIASSSKLPELLGAQVEAIPTVLTEHQASKIKHATDFNRALYHGSWFPFGRGNGFFQPLAVQLMSADYQANAQRVRIPAGLFYRREGLDLSSYPGMDADRVKALKKILALGVFEELYHFMDAKAQKETKLPASPTMARFLKNRPDTFLSQTRRMENAVFIAMYYEYGLLDSKELVKLFLDNHPRRDLLKPDGEWGPHVLTALEQVREEGGLPDYEVHARILGRLGLELPAHVARRPNDCLGRFRFLGTLK